ncbi:hypothetical protein RYH73_03485 [Olivibacter sp. CPCC 100613]|uniref:hypothetical protein n=1 Tax=Olivibacter sp. CPCC 100613 TaxID=3079931 RepID=UPI002FF9F5FB
MRMIVFSALISLLVFHHPTRAQTRPQLAVRLNQNNDIAFVRILYPELQVDLNGNGQLINTWNQLGEETLSLDYYDEFKGKEKQGKLKSMGSTQIDYYDNFDGEARKGKVKRIGDITVDYYDRFDGILAGKIKSIGNQRISYYDQFSGNEKKGKLKSVGSVQVEYYDRFDGNHRAGKIKSITGNEQENVRILFN